MSAHDHRPSAEIAAKFEQYVIPNYVRYPISLVRGEQSWIWDAEGRRYLDLFPGWGCNLLGHCPPRVVEAVQKQVAELIHVPNTWLLEKQAEWAELLSQRSFGGQAFFCNSGTEANEAAIKLARLHGAPSRYKIITFQGGFHGRTLGSLTATAQPKYHEGLGPLVGGFTYCPFGDLSAVEDRIDDETCAILIEPVQGEGGVRIPPEGFLQGLRQLCDQHELLLIFDEVQTGCGRLGTWFGYQHFGVTPDVMTLAKSLCGGIAGGAMLCRSEIAPALRPGTHASTFGGNPIASAAGIAYIQTIEEEGLLDRARELSEQFRTQLTDRLADCPWVEEIRVAGLMIGVELSVDGAPVVQACLDQGLLINCTQGSVIRLLPAMTLRDEQLMSGCEILCHAITQLEPTQVA